MPGSILGTRVLRTEDPALLTGAARYLNDLDLPGKLHAVFARSEVAHARLGAVHIDDAAAVPGVVAVFTAETLGVAPHHGFVTVHPDFARPPLADGRRCASSARRSPSSSPRPSTAAADGAAAVWADYEPLDADRRRRGRLRRRRAGDLPRPRQQRGARRHRPAARPRGGQRRRRARPLRQPARRRRADGARTAAPPSPATTAALTFYASTQMPHGLQPQLAKALGMDRARHPRHQPRRSAAGSAARPASAPSTRPSPPPPATSTGR